MTRRSANQRQGGAAVELALMLPLLMLLFVATVDFARVYYVTQVVTECARRGAAYGANSDLADNSPYQSIQEAALAGAADLVPAPTIATGEEVDSTGRRCVRVTVTHSFSLISGFFGSSSSWTISRTAHSRINPTNYVD